MISALSYILVVWLNDNALILISKLALCWAQLVPGWQVNHLSAEPATQVYSAWPSLRCRCSEYQQNLWSKQADSVMH